MSRITVKKSNTPLLPPFLCLLLASALISCSSSPTSKPNQSSRYDVEFDSAPSQQVDVSLIPDAVPQQVSRSRSGNPDSYEVFGKRYHILPSSDGYKERGIASWYGSKFHGKRTSSGEAYDMHAMTAAHKTLPIPAYVKVTNLNNGRQVILKVNDRGPFHENRIIDLSHTAAVKLGIKSTGTGLVEVEVITPGQKQNMAQTPQPAPNMSTTAASTVVQTTVNKPISLYLQLGAFVSSKNAYRLKDKVNLSLSTRQANVSTLETNGQQYYRVRLGPLKDIEQADSMALLLTEKGFNQHRIVIE